MYNEGRKRGSVLNGRVIIMAENVRKVGKYKVKVITGENTSAEAISKRDKEMDNRAVEAVKSAIKKAKICRKPIAGYDIQTKQAYVKHANGVKTYVN